MFAAIYGYLIRRRSGAAMIIHGEDVRAMGRVLEILDTLYENTSDSSEQAALNTTRNTLALISKTMRERA